MKFSGSWPSPTGGASPDLLIIAGEHSGDEHAARIIKGMLLRDPKLKIAALGGPRMEEAGAQLLYEMTSFSVVGLWEVLKNYGFFKKLFHETLRWIETYRPKAICLVDYPGFNLRLAKALDKKGLTRKSGRGEIRVCAYISPQVWAWKSRRRFQMERWIDELGVIFPFEVDVFRDTRLPTFFVGHPFVMPDYELLVHHDPSGPVLLLPGSRTAPVRRIFPVLLRAFSLFRKGYGPVDACVLYPSEGIREVLETEMEKFSGGLAGVSLRPIGNPIGGRAVLTSSGTMSLQCALAGIPGAIVYRADSLTYALGRRLVRVPYLGIANLLLNKPVYPEFIQGQARPESLAAELKSCCGSEERIEATREDAAALRHLLSANRYLDADAWVYEFTTGRSPGTPVLDRL